MTEASRSMLGQGGDDENIFGFIQSLPHEALDALYEGRPGEEDGGAGVWTCRAVLQSLPPLSKQYVMRLLSVDRYVECDMLKGWIAEGYDRVHKEALRKLLQLRVMLQNPKAASQLRLNPKFQVSLTKALCSTQRAPWRNVNLKPDKSPPAVSKIEADMHRKWNSVLHYLVGSNPSESGVPEPPPVVIDFMVQAELMRDTAGGMSITNKGYEFMLKDIHMQAWLFVLALMRKYGQENESMVRDDLLSFLFQLSYCKVGDDYPKGSLTAIQQRLMEDFVSLGILFQRKPKSSRFYPTPIAVNLIFGSSSGPSLATVQQQARQQISRGAAAGPLAGSLSGSSTKVSSSSVKHLSSVMTIIIETNFQVVAYTSSNLHMAMLSLFVSLRCRLPNMITGVLTRDSIRKALITGISARQILDFLTWHAHPSITSRSPIVPENIADQILLWERERSRVRFDKGVLISLTGSSEENFASVVSYAYSLEVPAPKTATGGSVPDSSSVAQGGHLWSSVENRVLICTPATKKQIESYANNLLSKRDD